MVNKLKQYGMFCILIIFVSLLTKCNLKSGFKESQAFYITNKDKMTTICMQYINMSNVSSISINEIKDNKGKSIDINTFDNKDKSDIEQIREFIKEKNILRISTKNENRVILFYLGNMDGIAFTNSIPSEFFIEKGFGQFIKIDEKFYYFIDKTI